VDAAVDCILEQGYYRATSNQIARRAGVSWGVIQYHFGSRERLLLAVLEDATERFSTMVQSADISAPSVEERLARYLAALASYYGEPAYLAGLQVVLNLSHDPATSEDAARALADNARRTNRRLHDLAVQVIGPGGDEALVSLLFHACRGLAVSHLIARVGPTHAMSARSGGDFDHNATLLVDALTRLVTAAGDAERRR